MLGGEMHESSIVEKQLNQKKENGDKWKGEETKENIPADAENV